MTVVAVDQTTVQVYDSRPMFRCVGLAYLCDQYQCCSRLKTTSIFALRVRKSKKVEWTVASLQLRLLRSFALGTTQNVTGDHA